MDLRNSAEVRVRRMLNAIEIVSRLREFIKNEAEFRSMDFSCVTPEYVYRMWGGDVPLEIIEKAMKEINA